MSSGLTEPDGERARKPKRVTPPKAVPPKAVPPKAVPPKAVPPKAVPPKAVPPKAVPPKAVPPKAAHRRRATAQPAPRKPAPGKPRSGRAGSEKAGSEKAEPPTPKKSSGGAQDPLIGRTIGRCQIEALVGVGRTARVYRAHYEALDDTVAVKVLRREVAEHPVLVARFESEARAIAKVDNENVLKIYDVGRTDDGLYYMVVELLEGEEILELVQREGQVDPMDALRIVRQAAHGLRSAHAHHLVHRDIKPQNLFLLEDGTVKVVDFGLATGIDDKNERVGTPHYMAPEVCENAKAETASDIYGLGIVLFHLLTGQPPYAGKDITQIMRAHIAGVPLRPERERPGLGKDVGDVVRLLTKRDPLMRPTADEVVEALDRIGGKELKKKGSLRRSHGRSRSAVARRDKARSGTPAVAAIIAGIAVVGVIFAVVSGSGSDRPRSRAEQPTESADANGIVGPGSTTPMETAAAKKSREARAAERARVKEGEEALLRAEQWAREHWSGPADTDAVLAKYRYVKEQWKDQPPGEEAKTRMREIKAHKRHPHPDRKWTSADDLAAARAAWKAARPEVEAKIAAFDYAGARALVPGSVSDESGSLSRELDFWRTYTQQLVDYEAALAREVGKLPVDERRIATPDGVGIVEGMGVSGFRLKLARGLKTYTWRALGAEAIADLGIRVFGGKSADLLILQIAFTYAHAVKDAFWDAQLEFGVTSGSSAHSRMNKAYKKRFAARASK